MIDINDYKEIYNNKIKSTTKHWLMFIIFIIIGIIYINNSFKYIKYYSNIGEYKDGYLYIYVLLEEIKKISYNEEMIIEKKKFAYKVIDISKDNIYMNNNYYKEIKLTIEKNNFINNEVIKFNIKIEELEILKYVYETVWR